MSTQCTNCGGINYCEPDCTKPNQTMITPNLEQIARETADCAARIREIIDTEQFPKDGLWIPTIRAHASVILDNLAAITGAK